MKVSFDHNGIHYAADLAAPIDLSIVLREGFDNVNCFYAPPVSYEPVRAGSFVGSTAEGGVVNFLNVRLNPHGNGTHTECVGHIAKERHVLHQCLREHHFGAKLVSVFPQKMDNGDRVIVPERIQEVLTAHEARALIVRTLPNPIDKQKAQYAGANPPYFHPEAIAYMVECGIEHLLTDLPSVDREEDGGLLSAHKTFWNYPGPAVRLHATITELIYVPDTAKDGLYLLNLQTASFDMDASPSKPILYLLQKIN
jgi:arylformamidase